MVAINSVNEGCDDVCVQRRILLFGGFRNPVLQPAR